MKVVTILGWIPVRMLRWAGVLLLLSRAFAVPACAATDIFEINRQLGRGVNLGNALDAPREGAWGMRLEAEFFQKIREAGFQSIRLPMRWSAHAAATAPFTIREEFFLRVDWALDQAATHGLRVMLNLHHYEELATEPAAHRERFLALWRQIARRYADRPESVVFEPMNEPNGQMTDERWNDLLEEVLGVIRESNPMRAVVFGPGGWNNVSHLPGLRLPERDRRLIVTVHYYSPFPFTHQGASWVGTNPPPVGVAWEGSTAERAALVRDFDAVAAWGREHRRPMHLGEFGAYEKAEMNSRARWTRAVREVAEARDISWAYWEFGAGFGLYDRRAGVWRDPLLKALVE